MRVSLSIDCDGDAFHVADPATSGVVTASTGGGQAHSNVQPSFVVKVWKRTA